MRLKALSCAVILLLAALAQHGLARGGPADAPPLPWRPLEAGGPAAPEGRLVAVGDIVLTGVE